MYIADTSTVPSGGWRYIHPDGVHFIVYPYGGLYDEVVKVYTANKVTPPTWDQIVLWMCQTLSIRCIEGNQPFANLFTQGLPGPSLPSSCCSSAKKAPAEIEGL